MYRSPRRICCCHVWSSALLRLFVVLYGLSLLRPVSLLHTPLAHSLTLTQRCYPQCTSQFATPAVLTDERLLIAMAVAVSDGVMLGDDPTGPSSAPPPPSSHEPPHCGQNSCKNKKEKTINADQANSTVDCCPSCSSQAKGEGALPCASAQRTSTKCVC